MIKIGQELPQFSGVAVKKGQADDLNPNNAFIDISNKDYQGKWLILFFWPKDFTFVCPTEIAEFSNLAAKFDDRDAKILGASTDSEFVHLAWRQNKEELKNLEFEIYSDIKRDLTQNLGILDDKESVAQRATFIIDPQGVVRFVYVTDLNVGRNPSEVLRVLDALQTDELCPCNWQAGNDTIKL